MIPLLLYLALQTGDPFAEGVRAYRADDFEAAFTAFAAADAEAGETATPELLYDLALAALRAGKLREAEVAAERAAARGGAEFGARRDFLVANVAFTRSAQAKRQATQVEAEPFAFDVAIAHARTALRAWQAAAMAPSPNGGDWPEARRNAERALLELDELARLKAAAEKRQAEKLGGQPEVKLIPVDDGKEPEAPDRPEEEAVQPDAQLAELKPDDVRKLLDKLAAKEKEKLAIRRRQQQERHSGVEKDW